MILFDRALSQRLERAEGRSNAAFVEARRRITPETGAEWIEVAGVYAMYDGAESPCTQTFGLGLFDLITAHVLDSIEAFFLSREAPVFHEVTPIAGVDLVPLLNGRGYRPVELSNVLCCDIEQTLAGLTRRAADVTTRPIGDTEVDLWAQISARGWSTEHEGLADFMFDFGRVAAQSEGSHPFIAELEARPVAAGGLFIHDDLALLAGASTIPEARNHGAQNALLFDRLKFAGEQGCKLASMAALPGSQSQINAQKNGFQVAYTRTKWQLNR